MTVVTEQTVSNSTQYILAAFAGPNQRAPSWFSIECLNGPKTLKKNAAAVEGGWVTVSLLHIWALFWGWSSASIIKKSFIIMNFFEKGLKSILDHSNLQIAISNVNTDSKLFQWCLSKGADDQVLTLRYVVSVRKVQKNCYQLPLDVLKTSCSSSS